MDVTRIPTPVSNERTAETTPEGQQVAATYNILQSLLSNSTVVRHFGEEQIVNWTDQHDEPQTELCWVLPLHADERSSSGRRLICFGPYDGTTFRYGVTSGTSDDDTVTEYPLSALYFELTLEQLNQAAAIVQSLYGNITLGRIAGIIP